jgi:NADH-quinone oxidoreductase subunit J
MSTSLAFLIVTVIALVSAVFVVRSSNLIHAVLWLGLALVGTAGLYAMLEASFLAGVQVLVYVGGVITLMIFGVMITRRHEGLLAPADSGRQAMAMLVALGFFGVIAVAILSTPDLDKAPLVPASYVPVSAADLGRSLLREYVLAFEVISFLLLGAIIGAIVIARRHDPLAAPRPRVAPRVPIAAPIAAPIAPTASTASTPAVPS